MPAAVAALPLWQQALIWVGVLVSTYIFTPKPKAFAQGAQVLSTTDGTVTPWRVIYGETRAGGALVFQSRTGRSGYTGQWLYQVHVLACHQCESVEAVYVNDVEEIESGDWSADEATHQISGEDALTVIRHHGSDAQTADNTLVTNIGGWTTDHRLRGLCYVVAVIKDDGDLWQNNLPRLTFRVKGRNEILDPRTSTEGYTANASLCWADYMESGRFGVNAGAKVANAYTRINETRLIAAANTCEESIAIPGPSSEDRYQINGVFDVDGSHEDILTQILSAQSGTMIYSEGKWLIYPGEHIASSGTITEDDLAGPIRIQPRVSRAEAFNAVKGVYQGPENNYVPSDYPLVPNSTYETEDGEQLLLDLDLPLVSSPYQCQRLAKIELEDSRQQIVVELSCNLSAYQYLPNDRVALTLDRYGWSAKLFRVLETQLAVEGSEDRPTVVVHMTLKETASGVYDWSEGEETTVDLAPDTDLVDPFMGAPAVPNMIAGGDFGPQARWQLTAPTSETAAYPDTLSDIGGYQALSDKANATDADDATAATGVVDDGGSPPEAGVDCTWAAGSKQGRLRVVMAATDSSPTNKIKAEAHYSLTGAAPFTKFAGTGSVVRLREYHSQDLGVVDMSQLVCRVISLTPLGTHVGSLLVYEVSFLELGGPYGVQGDNVLNLISDGVAYAEARRPFPSDRGNGTGDVIFSADGAGLTTVIALQRGDPATALTHDVECRLEDDMGNAWPVLTVAAADVLSTWRYFALWYRPTTDVQNTLDVVVRSKTSAPVRCDKFFEAPGRRIHDFALSTFEQNSNIFPDPRTPPPDGRWKPGGPWAVGTYKISEAA